MNKPIAIFVTWLAMSLTSVALAQSIEQTPHNLSVTGPGAIRAATESQICEFCHTPHDSSPAAALWNRRAPNTGYVPYASSTAVAQPGQPTGSSLLCLSCHDGTIALGELISRPNAIVMAGGITTMPPGSGLTGTDLRFDHPISFEYSASLAMQNGELAMPGSFNPALKLDAGGQLQCTTCHDAHDNRYGAFLVQPNVGSTLCTECHRETGWLQTSHSQSAATWDGQGQDPWPDTGFSTVADNGCSNCHLPHAVSGGPRLLRHAAEEDNCAACHTGHVADQDVMSLFSQFSSHRVQDTTLVHDPVEPAVVDVRHVECADCHDAHATQSARVAGDTPANVRGVSLSGTEIAQAINTYEICLRCHGESPNQAPSRTPRQLDQSNMRLKIQLNNPSFHPIAGPGRNSNVPSLISPLTEQSVIGCVDCHNSNQAASAGGGGPEGPHGSAFAPILVRNYETIDNTPESAANYALCYACHSRNSILNDQSFGEHDKHIRGEDTPCNACHDPHGVSSTQGNDTNNSHLINFDTSIVFPNSNGQLRFVDNGQNRGSCDLRCHGENHVNFDY
jgi:predicted CXXCH cytochrome family protein